MVHYVDDYGSINTEQDAQSSFHTFAQLNSILGFHMKPSKEQRPANEHKIQGDIIQCRADQISVKQCPNRIQRLLQELHNHLHTDSMSPAQARRLAGKCSFTTTHLFGLVGRAPLRALYDKSHSTTSTSHRHSTLILGQQSSLYERSCLIAYPKQFHYNQNPNQRQSFTRTPSFQMATHNSATVTSQMKNLGLTSTTTTPTAGLQ